MLTTTTGINDRDVGLVSRQHDSSTSSTTGGNWKRDELVDREFAELTSRGQGSSTSSTTGGNW